jgi:hypothetical protein
VNTITLPLHYGKAPDWLLSRMKELSSFLLEIFLDEFGIKEFMLRISNPLFFQAFSNLLGFDWNSSGATTVLCGVLKSVLNEGEYGIKVAGGKGRHGLQTPDELRYYGGDMGLKSTQVEELIYMSKISAAIDNSILQDGYDLYHHCMFVGENGVWAVIQQGMNTDRKMARRYHWNFQMENELNDPHAGIMTSMKHPWIINLATEMSEENRNVSLDIIKDGKVKRDFESLLSLTRNGGINLTNFNVGVENYKPIIHQQLFSIPRRVDWKAIERAYQLQPDNYLELIQIRGIGKETVRALSLISSLLYGADFSKDDPAKYCFAFGGKDGVPFPIKKDIYDETIEFMREVMKQKKLGDFSGINAIKNLSSKI